MAFVGPVQNESAGALVKKILKDFKMVTAEHHIKSGALLSTRPCATAQVSHPGGGPAIASSTTLWEVHPAAYFF